MSKLLFVMCPLLDVEFVPVAIVLWVSCSIGTRVSVLVSMLPCHGFNAVVAAETGDSLDEEVSI